MADDGYSFPRNEKATASTLEEQARKVVEEANEVLEAVTEGERPMRILEETWDCIQACEGILRRYGAAKVSGARAFVKIKCNSRGDYRL